MFRSATSRGVGLHLGLACAALVASACARAEPAPLRVATSTRLAASPLFSARATGSLPRADVRLVEFVTNLQSRRTLRSGDVESAVLASDEALQLAFDHPELELCVARALAVSHGATALLGPAELPTARPLRVGAEPGGTSAYLLARARALGVLPADGVELVPVAAGDVEEALDEGRVALVATSEPNVTRLQDRGLHRLFDSVRLPGEILELLIVRRDALPEHAEQLATLLRAFDAELNVVTPSAEAEAVSLGRARLSPAQLARARDGLRLLGGDEEQALRLQLEERALAQGRSLRQAGIPVDAALVARTLRPCPVVGGGR